MNPGQSYPALLHDPRVRKLSFTGSTALAACCYGKQPIKSSAAQWSWAATRRSLFSTTPTSMLPWKAR